MSEKEEIEVTIDEVEKNDKGADSEIRVEAEAEKPSAPTLETSIEDLRRQIEEERQARLAAEKRAAELSSTAAKAQEEVDKSYYQIVTNAIDTVKRETDILRNSYKVAMETGDFDRASQVHLEMNRLISKLDQLENGKIAMEEKQQNRAPIQPIQHSDPVEQMASNLSEKSAAWVRAHPEYARNPALTQKMIAAHQFAIADGLAADTPEYFNTVERLLGISNESSSAMSSASEPIQRRSAPAAAPVSRSGTANGTRPNVVRLTSEEREVAQMMGMSPEEYAKNKLALKREGKIH